MQQGRDPMTGEITIGLKDGLALIVGLGGPIAVYVGMREQIMQLKGEVTALTDLVKELRTDRGEHGNSLGEVREELAGLRVRVNALEHPRTVTGPYPALTNADITGPHKT